VTTRFTIFSSVLLLAGTLSLQAQQTTTTTKEAGAATQVTTAELTGEVVWIEGNMLVAKIKPNGDYLTIRANPLENTLVLWKFEKGKRSSVKWIRNTPTATRQWHDLKVRIAGTKVEGYLNGKLQLEHVLPEPVSGRVGLWSKADSYMHFDDFAAVPSE
jgi:hypothetical protein